MPPIQTDAPHAIEKTKRFWSFVIIVLAIVCSADFSVAQQSETATRPVFDEKFSHWPVQLKINGRIIVNRGVTDFKPVDRLLQQVTQGKCSVFSPAEDALGTKLKSLSKDENFTNSKCEIAQLKSALETSKTVYLAANSFTAKDLVGLKDQLNNFIQDEGNLIADASLGGALGSVQSDDTPGLNMIPDCYLDCDGDESEAAKQKLADGLPGRTVGVSVESKTMLVAAGRRLLSFGSGSTTLAIPGNQSQPATFQTLNSKRSRNQQPLADLTQWRRRAIDRSLPPFPMPKPKTPFVENGSLYIVGGGGMPAGLMKKMIEEAGGIEKAKCVFIPCSESDDVGERQGTVRMWKRMGIKHATFIHTKDRNKANSDEAFLEPLKDATMLWFGGGRQWNFADSYYGTEAHKLMKQVLHRGGVIGGSSAGASIQGRFLARATPIGNSNILAPGYIRGGLGFLSGVAIDQHFSQRGRQKDMTILVDKYPQILGIGLDEATAIIVRKSRAEVVGRGKVFFYNRKEAVAEGKPDYTAVPAGGVFDLLKREVIESNK